MEFLGYMVVSLSLLRIHTILFAFKGGAGSDLRLTDSLCLFPDHGIEVRAELACATKYFASTCLCVPRMDLVPKEAGKGSQIPCD